MDDVKYVIGVDDTDIVKTMLNHKKLMKEIAAVEKQYKFLARELRKGRLDQDAYKKAVEQVTKRVSELKGVLAGGSKAINDHATRMVQAGNKMNKFGMISQQVGYQVGDFFVQVQSGQNPMVAFAQQATQLAGLIPGIGGAIIGIGLAAGTFGYQMYKAAANVKDLEENVKDLQDALSSFNTVGDQIEKALKSPIDNSNKSLVEYLKNLKKAEAAATLAAAKAGFNPVVKQMMDEARSQERRMAMAKSGRGGLSATGNEARNAQILRTRAETIALAMAGPAEGLGKRLLDAEKKLRDMNYWTEDLADLFKTLVYDTGLVGQAIDENTEKVKKQTEAQEKQQKEAEKAFETRTKQNTLENEITSGLKSQIAYQAIVAKYGENSVKGKQELAKLARAEYEQEQLASGLRVEQVDRLMDVYDELQKVTGEAESFTDEAERTRKKLVEIDGVIKGIRGSISSLETSAIGDAARLAALKAGKSIEEAKLAGQIAEKQYVFGAAVSGMPDGARRATEEAHLREIELLKQQGATAAEIKAIEDKIRDSKKKTKKEQQDALEKAYEQLYLEREVLKTSDDRRLAIQALGKDYKKYTEEQIKALNKELEMNEQIKQSQALMENVFDSFGDAFTSIVSGTESVKGAFKSMASTIVSELWKIIVVEQMSQSLRAIVGAAFAGPAQYQLPGGQMISAPPPRPNANGNAFYGGNVIPFAKGGVVDSPMMFPMSGGNTGLMGEAGPEAIMPLKRGKGGKLGVVAESQGNVVINQNFNFSANGDESVKKIIAQAAPQIAQMTKSSIINDRRRGGSMKAAFG